jgi:hypothetical protein
MSLTLPNRMSLAPTVVISSVITPFQRIVSPCLKLAHAYAAVGKPLMASRVTQVLTPANTYLRLSTPTNTKNHMRKNRHQSLKSTKHLAIARAVSGHPPLDATSRCSKPRLAIQLNSTQFNHPSPPVQEPHQAPSSPIKPNQGQSRPIKANQGRLSSSQSMRPVREPPIFDSINGCNHKKTR